MRHFVALLLVSIALAGCMSVPMEMPKYVVLLLSADPDSRARCTGSALDERTILTAEHCIDNAQVAVTISGQRVPVVQGMSWPEQDVALLYTVQALGLPEYGVLADTPSTSGAIYGSCPRYMMVTPRPAKFMTQWFTLYTGEVRSADMWVTIVPDHIICGGDSGAAIVSARGIEGVLIAVHREADDSPGGNTFFATSTSTIRALIDEFKAESTEARPDFP